MALKFEITGDNSNLLNSLDGAREGVRSAARDIEESGMGIEDVFRRIASAAGIAFSLEQAKSFISKVADVRGYFQDIESSMEVFLGSQQKAQEFTEKLKDYAYYNMFEFSDLAAASKQMIAYGHDVDTVIPRLDQLSNIARGTNADLMEMVGLYNRAKNLGSVGSQGLASWATKGLVVTDVLKEMGVEVEGSTVSFEQLNMVLDKVTGEGGMFHDLMLSQMNNITAEQGQLADDLTSMYNEIGEKYQDYISGAIKAEDWLVSHYKEVGSVIMGLIASYGEYQAVLKVTRAIENTMTRQANGIEQTRQAGLGALYTKYSDNSDIMSIGQETASEEASTAAILQNTASREGNVYAIDEQIAALERKMLCEIGEYDKIMDGARAAIEAASIKEEAASSEAETLQRQVDTANEYLEMCNQDIETARKSGNAQEVEAATREYNRAAVESENLEKSLATAESNRESAASARLTAEKNLETAANRKVATQEKLTNFQREVGTTQTKAQTTATGLWIAMMNGAKASLNSLKAAIAANPFGLALAAITTIISLLPIFADETDEVAQEVERFGESAVKQTRNLETLMAVVANTAKDSTVHKDAVDELCKIYDEYGFHIDSETDKLQQLKTMHDLVTEAIRREGEERQRANMLQGYDDDLKTASDEMRNKLLSGFKNAEWEGSGLLDDYDAGEYQERPKELAQLVGDIIDSESQSLSTLTGDELEAKTAEVYGRIKTALEKMGLETQKWFYTTDLQGNDTSYYHDIDVDMVKIMSQYGDAIRGTTASRKLYLESCEDAKKANEDEAKSVDYSSMSIAELAKAASAASDDVSGLGNTSASPYIDPTSIDSAGFAASDTKGKIDLLNGLTAQPLINTTSIDIGISKTNTLLGNMSRLGLQGGKQPMSLGFNPNKFGFGTQQTYNYDKQAIYGGKNAKFVTPFLTGIEITDPKLLAQMELNRKINNANSQSAVDKLLKEVNAALNDAEFDSDEYKELEKLQKRIESKSRKRKGRGGKSGKNNAGKVAGAENGLREALGKLDFDRQRAAKDLETKVAKARLEAMEDGEDKVRLLKEQQNKEELDTLERQKEDAVRKYIDEEKKIFEKRKDIEKAKNPGNKGQEFDESAVDTSAIGTQYDQLIEIAKARQLRDTQREAIQSMRDFLKEYGSFEQQRLATTEEYEQKIAKAATQGEKLGLEKERDERLGSLGYENIAGGIDWKALFSGVGTISKEMMQPMMDKLTAYTKTDEYLNADSQTKSQVAELIQEMRQYLGTDQSFTWQSLGLAMQDFVSAVGVYNHAVEEEQAAVARLEQAKRDLKDGKIAQSDYDSIKAEADKLGEATAEAKDTMEGFGVRLNDTSEQVANFTSKLTAALKNSKGWEGVNEFGGVEQAVGRIDDFKGALDTALPSMGDGVGKKISEGLSSAVGKGLSTVGEGLSKVLSSGLGTAIGFVAQIPRLILDLVSSVKQFVTGVLDTLTEVISLRWIDDLVVNITDAVGNLVDAIFNLPENLFKMLEGIVVDGVGGLLNKTVGRVGNVLSFGLLDSGGPASWFTNSNAKEVAKTIERLTEENKNLEQSIEDLREEMEQTRGAEAIDVSMRASGLQKQTIENYKAMAQAQAGYHGSHHSWNYYWGGYSQEQISRLSGQIGRQWNGDIWSLSPEEMKMLRSNVDMWKKIGDTGKGGYGSRLTDKLNDYIEQAGKLQKLTDELYENLTTTTKGNVFEEFLNSLYDLADGSEDVFANIAENWQKMVNKMVINNLVGEKFQEKLESWYEDLAKLNVMKTNGWISDAEYRRRLNALKDQYEGYVRAAQGDIEMLRNEGIIKTSEDNEYKQEASSKGFQSMGQDTAEELNGRFTALQISGDIIAQQAVSMYAQMISMTAIQTSSNNSLLEIRNMMITATGYLEDVVKYSKKMYLEFSDKLDSVVSNTKNL